MRPRGSRPDRPARMSCGQARELARRVLAEVGAPPVLVTDVLMVVSELVSNAIRHAGGPAGFHIYRRSGVIIVEVSDHSPRLPQLRPRSPNLPGHFGWRLVKTLAPTVFIRFHRGGKTITAPLPLHPTPHIR
ncbi:ATP-binding protein [Streptomyces sp. NPDC005533]|uniref:ATP-binding protein n=1 Tax=Streptomyces sp. NPDC005533 TaxID=3364723 RepID=UPI003680A533